MANLDNLKTFCGGLTEDEKEFLIRTELQKMWQLFRDTPASALLAMKAYAEDAKKVDDLPPEMKSCFSKTAITPFQDPKLIELTEVRIDSLRKLEAAKRAEPA